MFIEYIGVDVCPVRSFTLLRVDHLHEIYDFVYSVNFKSYVSRATKDIVFVSLLSVCVSVCWTRHFVETMGLRRAIGSVVDDVHDVRVPDSETQH